jgi:uncharacterized protein DUF4054
MTDLNQNFSLMVANDIEVFFDIGPDDDSAINLDFVQSLTWSAYDQQFGVPIMATPLIQKGIGSGIEVTDPLLMKFTVTLDGMDTAGLSGNYYHEVKIVADRGALTTAATGLMTVIDPAINPNVVSFKAMFPDFAAVDDTLVQIALDSAGQFVGTNWEESQVPATMFLAAHFLSLSSAATGDTSGMAITSESLGRISLSYANASASGTATDTLAQTKYGNTFANMLTAQGFGIAVI